MKEDISINRLILKKDEKTLEKYNQYVKDIAIQVIEELSDKQKKELLKDTNYTNYHFGLGMYIRNNYIYGKVDMKVEADCMSSDIFYMILKLLEENKINKNKSKKK